MTIDEYIAQERSVRKGIHFHDGVWWKRTSLGCCQPVYPLLSVDPDRARPSRRKALVRYSHLVPQTEKSNHQWVFMFLEGESLRSFSLDSLPYEKRKALKRAMKEGVEVRKLHSIHDYWVDLKEIFISTAERTSYGLPPAYYVEKETKWRESLVREFSLPGRDWFGAFLGKKLVAYQYSCLVGSVASLLVTKHNDAYRLAKPGDALLFGVISYYRDHPDCAMICAGRSNPMTPGIDRFKQSYGFSERVFPAYQWINPVLKVALVLTSTLARRLPASMASQSRRGLLYRLLSAANSAVGGSRKD